MKTTIVLDNVEVEVEYKVLPPGDYPDQPNESIEIYNMTPNLDDHEDEIAEQIWEDWNPCC